ncbi:hypothetical protein [Nocardioides psychrotolerans]|uniref:hypothetical protein n=1 Tax=Nocardioides psychrotolerans TaxID=1005945 RepID=UPI003137FD82
MANLTFAEAITGEEREAQPSSDPLDVRAQGTRLDCYWALTTWEVPEGAAPSRSLPSRRELVERAGIGSGTFSDTFGQGKRPALVSLMYRDGETPPADFQGVGRCVLEAKEFTITPWLRGWNVATTGSRFDPVRRAESLIRVTSAWAIRVPALAVMGEVAMPPVFYRAARTLGGDPESVATLARQAVGVVVDRGKAATPTLGLDQVRVPLIDQFQQDRDGKRRSDELAQAICEYMLLRGTSEGIDPALLDTLKLAALELDGTSGRAT